MGDNNVNELLGNKVPQPMIPFLKRSRDVDYLSDEYNSNSQSKQRYAASRRSTKVTSTSHSTVTSKQGTYNLREKFIRDQSESPVDIQEKKLQRSEQSRSKRHLVVNGAVIPDDEGDHDVKTYRKRNESSRSINTSDYSSDEAKESETLKGTAFPIYKKAGDWWDVFPKTDYTYSSVSPNRKEIAPGIIAMPNMSRHSFRTSSSSDFTRSLSSSFNNDSTWWFGSRVSDTRSRRRRQFMDVDSDDDVDIRYSTKSSVKSSVKSSYFFTRIFTSIWSFLLYVTKSFAETTRRIFTRNRIGPVVHNLADFGSDVEDTDLVSTATRSSQFVGSSSRTLVGSSRSTAVSSHQSTFFLTRFFSSLISVLRQTARRMFFISDSHQVTPQVSRSSHQSWWERVGVWHYWTVCKTLILDSWLLKLFSKGDSHTVAQVDSRPSRLKYLLFLLLPLLIFAAWWFLSSDDVTAENSKQTMMDSASSSKTNRLWWLLIPFTYFWVPAKEKIIISNNVPLGTDQEQAVDLEFLVQKIVNNENFQNLVLSEAFRRDHERRKTEQEILSNLQLQKETLEQELNHKNELLDIQQKLHMRLADEVEVMKQHMENLEIQLQTVKQVPKDPVLDSSPLWRRAIRKLENKIRLLEVSLSSRPCCRSTPPPLPTVAIEEHVMTFLSGLFNSNGEAERKIPGIQTWIEKLFVAKDDLETKLANITSNMNVEVNEASRRSAQTIMAMVSEQIRTEYLKQQAELSAKLSREKNWILPVAPISDNCTLTVSQVQNIVNSALNTYDADKTGMVDYALESSGGSIINTRCTDTYNARTATLSLFGVPLWWPSSNPRTVIQPGVSPGECWAFRGAQGYLVIRLSGPVKISAFSVEHIPVSLAPNGRIDSAPKDFSVWGLKNENDKDPELLGRYIYRDNGTGLQIFSVQRTDLPPFDIVELRIESNHGNLEYTCLYRFRVHGVLSKK